MLSRTAVCRGYNTATTADREQKEQHGATLGNKKMGCNKTDAKEAADEEAKAAASSASTEKAGPQTAMKQAGSAECGQVVGGGKGNKRRMTSIVPVSGLVWRSLSSCFVFPHRQYWWTAIPAATMCLAR